MKLYLLNALITPFEAEENEMAVFVVQKVSQLKWEQIFKQSINDNMEVVSVIGHQTTVDFLKEQLPDGLNQLIIYHRGTVNMEEGDMALIFRITERGENIQQWSLEEIRNFHNNGKTEFLILSRVYAPEVVFNPANFLLGKE